jgi:hypothetical protein
MRRCSKLLFVACLAICGLSFLAASAQACPMCSQSIAEEDLLPHAYMYSILFMLGMPATVFAGFGTMIYLKFRKFSASQPSGGSPSESPSEFAPAGEAQEPALAPQL